ncbi:MAG: thiamine-phosphate kinase, partial [Flavobacteriaceae bacterium]
MLENKKSPNTPLSSLGEFALIEHLTKKFSLTNKSSLLGIGDDAAIINDKDKLTLITTDLLIEGVHFDLGYVPLKHLGYK